MFWATCGMLSWGSEYLKKGGDELVFDALLAPEDLPEWCKSWNSMSDENYESRMDEAVKKHLLESFLEYEVLERSGGVLGTAICKVGEIKVAKGQTSLKIIHLAASDDRYEKWAQENFNVESGYQLHLCKKVDDEGSCVARPLSGKVTWCHVRKWRLLSLVDCGEVAYAKAASIDWLVKLLQEVEAAEQKKRQEKREALPENKDDDETKARGCRGCQRNRSLTSVWRCCWWETRKDSKGNRQGSWACGPGG